MTEVTGPTIGVGIVNYNTCSALRACLESLAGQDGVDMAMVADNGSSDGSLDMVRRDFPHVDTISLPTNPGYGAAANELARVMSTDVVVLLNADVRLPPGAIAGLTEHLVRHPEAAVVGPRLVGNDGRLQRSCFADPTVTELVWAESGLHRFRPAMRRGAIHTFDHDRVRSVPWVLGAVMAIRRAAFDEVGGFDEDFFLYYEEVDLCGRLRACGWDVQFTPEIDVVHEGGASIGQRRESGQRTLYHSLNRYHRKHGSASPLALRSAIATIMAARLVRDGFTSRWARSDRARQESTASIAAWRGVMGDARRGWRPRSTPEPPARSDWLSLLPTVGDDPVVVMIGGVTPGQRSFVARHFGVDQVASSVGDQLVDVLIVLADAEVSLSHAFSAVAPGGVVYAERRRGRRGPTARGLRRAAQRAGTTVCAQHWLIPDATAPNRLVPLDDDTAIRWYLDHLFSATNVVTAVARRVMHAVPSVAAWLAPAHSVVAVRGATRSSELLDACPSSVAVSRTDRLLVLTSGYDVGSRSVILPFGSGRLGPKLAIKVSSRPAVNETTEREYAVLQALSESLPTALAHSVPRPVGSFVWHDRFVSVETLLGGETLETHLRRRTGAVDRIEAMRDVAEWVTCLHQSTASRVTWSEAETQRWMASPFVRFAAEFDAPPRVMEMFRRALDRCDELVGLELPIVRRHVDLGPWNVIRTEDGPGVIDWETSSNRPVDGLGLPLCDLSYFVKYWLHIVGDATTLDDELALFPFLDAPPGRSILLEAARSVLRRYCDDLGVDARFVGVLLLHNWVEHALNGAERHRLLGRDGPAPRSSAVAFVEALADHVENLFHDPIGLIAASDRRHDVTVTAPLAPRSGQGTPEPL